MTKRTVWSPEQSMSLWDWDTLKHSPQTLPSCLVLARNSNAVQTTYVLLHILTPAPVYSGYGDPKKDIMELRGHLVCLRCKSATQIWRVKSQVAWNPVYKWGMFHCSCIIGDMFLPQMWDKDEAFYVAWSAAFWTLTVTGHGLFLMEPFVNLQLCSS